MPPCSPHDAPAWSGSDGAVPLGDGASYDPGTDTWSAIPAVGAPPARDEPCVVWTGSRMMVWGGTRVYPDFTQTGGSFDPTGGTWSLTALAGAPSARSEAAGPVVTASMGEGSVRADSLYLGGVVGYTMQVAAGWRLELLAEGGAHDVYSVWESRYTEGDVQFELPSWSISQHAKVILPYAGARVGVSREWDHPRSWSGLWSRSSAIGLHAFGRRDLSSGTSVVDYSAFVPVCIGGCPTPTTASYAIGGWSVGLAVEMAAGW